MTDKYHHKYRLKASKTIIPPTHRETRFIEEPEGNPVPNPVATECTKTDVLVPVLTGSPWNHYEAKYAVEYWCPITSAISRSTSKLALIRTINPPATKETVHHLRTILHQNIAQTIEIYASTTEMSIVSEFMPTSLQQLCRSPIYPSEPELSSIVYQVCEEGMRRVCGS